jgi:ATP-dependent helicase HrpA
MLSQIGMRDPEKGDYRGARSLRFAIHPGSGLFKKQPAWLMAAELVDTARLYARRVAAIQPDWIEPLARHLCKYSHHSPYWDAAAGTARALERVTLHGLLLSDGRRRDYSRIDPAFSRELFIRHGLVEGDLPRPVPDVVRANLALFAALRDANRKTRGKAPLDEEALVQAYDRLLPAEVVNVPALRTWLKRASAEKLAALRLSPDSLSSTEAPTHLYPDRITLGGHSLALAYRHDPTADDDGITCTVPIDAVPLLRRWPADWLVPGALPDKLAYMLSSIPKPLARPLPPAARAVPRLLPRLGQPTMPLAAALRAAVRAEFNIEVPHDTWPEDAMPAHLRVRFRVVDDRGREVFVSRSLAEIEEFHTELQRLAKESPVQADLRSAPAERDGLTTWDCGTLPASVAVGEAGWKIVNYPALVEEEKCVALRWFADTTQAARAHIGGVRRLYALALGKSLATLAGGGVIPRDTALSYTAIGGNPAELKNDVANAVIDAVLLPPTEPTPRDPDTFRQRLDARRSQLAQAARTQWQLVESALALAAERERELTAAHLPAPVADDIREQLAWLVFPGFARHVCPERLEHYGRYLEALRLRIVRARENAARDVGRTTVIRPYWERYCEAVAADGGMGLDATALSAYRWAVEEFRVSQHAQELRTPEPVSAQRLDRLWQATKS